jgi:hypothetical protein
VSTDDRPPEYDAEIEVCGEIFYFARTLGLGKRLEQRFGPLTTMMRRFETYDVTQDTIAAFVGEILRGGDFVPDAARIRTWVFEEGTPKLCTPLARICGDFFIGNRLLREHEAQRLTAAEGTAKNPR